MWSIWHGAWPSTVASAWAGKQEKPCLDYIVKQVGVTGETHTHRGRTIFAPLLFWTVPPVDYITIHFMLPGSKKQQVSSALCFRGWYVSIQKQMEVEGDPTRRINNNTAENLPLHQGQLSFPLCVSKTKKGSAGPSVLAHPCPCSMPPLPAALWSFPRAEHCSISRRMGCWQVAGRWGYTCWLLLGAQRGQTPWDFLDALQVVDGFVRHSRQSQDHVCGCCSAVEFP